MKFVGDFPSTYAIEVDAGWPDRGEDEISFLAFDKLGMHTGEFSIVRFRLDTGTSWIGRFEIGQKTGEFENCIFSTPNPTQACLISFGAGYWVDVEQKTAMPMECLPITQAVVAPKQSLIIVVTWRDLYAYSSAKPSWSLTGLVSDRLKVREINQDIIKAEGFTGEMIEISVDLLTGRLI